LKTPESLLRSLGVDSATGIELEAIAWYCGLAVRYAPLAGCDARIVGRGDRGVLTVNSAQSPARRRFSLAHELGHWQLHRGRLMLCRAEEIEGSITEARGLELDADQYAAALLMPRYLFVSAAAELQNKPPWAMAEALAAQFQSSLLATALRMITLDVWPGWLVCHTREGRPFSFKAPSVEDIGRPPLAIDHRSAGFDVVHANATGVRARKVAGDVWFAAAKHRIAMEYARAYPPERVLTFVRLL
jgi:hypothetical protein